LQKVQFADGTYTEKIYDAAGRLLSLSDSISGPIQYVYPDTGCSTCGGVVDKVIEETTPLGSISYSYDAIGRRTSMTVVGQPSVNYQYDTNSLLTEINSIINGGAAAFSLRYDSLGRRTSLTYPNGVTTNYNYDTASNLLNLEHLNPLNQILESLSYAYDENRNRTSMNRVNASEKIPEAKANITYNSANHMLIFDDKSMVYDENGNLTSVTDSCGTTTYKWDARNRLVGMNGFTPNCQAITATFKYDALNRRIEKTINQKTIQYLYAGGDIVQEIEQGAVSANYLRTLGIDEPLVRLSPDGTRFYQTDALGSIIALTDETGVSKTQYGYDPFGNVTISGETSDNPFEYTGRENDGTGLYYYRARYYSPELQRFISEDPICWRGGNNFYTYVTNNPVKLKDPSGTGPCEDEWMNCAGHTLEGEIKCQTQVYKYGTICIIAGLAACIVSNIAYPACAAMISAGCAGAVASALVVCEYIYFTELANCSATWVTCRIKERKEKKCDNK
jgi:RHS repeat-associated protein